MKATKSTKIVFFGTSDRSLPILESLKGSFNLVLCITKTNAKVGRDQKEKETGVKTWAKKNNVSFIEIKSLKNDDLEYVVSKIEEYKPEYGIVADFTFIIPKKIIQTLKNNIINIHFSLLPKYRGASPVQHAILNGDEATGVTYYVLDEKMDTGDVIGQIEYKVTNKETSGELYDKLFDLAGEKLTKIMEKFINGEITPLPQDESKTTYTFSKSNPKHTFIFKEDAQIDWNEGAEKIERSIRAYNPWPISWTYLKDLEKSQCLSDKVKLKDHVNKDLKVKIYKADVLNSKLTINELQVEGKNKVSWEEFKNGYLDSDISTA